MTTIIKGSPRETWEEVQAIQHKPFIYIQSNGSKWFGDEADGIDNLLKALKTYELDIDMFGRFYHENPCTGVINDKYNSQNGEPKYIDGPRLYECDGVFRFFGNFLDVSHVFCIDTNDKKTILELITAINKNLIRINHVHTTQS